jgi:epoxyqueuosine reductase QueG
MFVKIRRTNVQFKKRKKLKAHNITLLLRIDQYSIQKQTTQNVFSRKGEYCHAFTMNNGE